MDLLQFDARDLYFETEDSEDVRNLIRSASELPLLLFVLLVICLLTSDLDKTGPF